MCAQNKYILSLKDIAYLSPMNVLYIENATKSVHTKTIMYAMGLYQPTLGLVTPQEI